MFIELHCFACAVLYIYLPPCYVVWNDVSEMLRACTLSVDLGHAFLIVLLFVMLSSYLDLYLPKQWPIPCGASVASGRRPVMQGCASAEY